jgi:hypothetical protein
MLIAFLTLFDFSCKGHRTKKESKVSQPHTFPDTITLAVVSAGSMLPSKTVFIDGIEFTAVLRQEDTLYLMTNNRKFVTPEGYRVGMQLKELNKSLRKNLQKEPGWGYYAKLKSGWNLGFCEGSSCTEHYPLDTSKVYWAFKRK